MDKAQAPPPGAARRDRHSPLPRGQARGGVRRPAAAGRQPEQRRINRAGTAPKPRRRARAAAPRAANPPPRIGRTQQWSLWSPRFTVFRMGPSGTPCCTRSSRPEPCGAHLCVGTAAGRADPARRADQLDTRDGRQTPHVSPSPKLISEPRRTGRRLGSNSRRRWSCPPMGPARNDRARGATVSLSRSAPALSRKRDASLGVSHRHATRARGGGLGAAC